jgi:hypothetical protein
VDPEIGGALIGAGVGIATLVGAFGGSMWQAKRARQHDRDHRLWTERLTLYADAAIAAERARVKAYNLTQTRYGDWGPTLIDPISELTPTGVLTARIEALAPAAVRAAWTALVAAEHDLRVAISEYFDDGHDPAAPETPGWAEGTAELAAVRVAVERFRQAVREAVGNRD